VFSEFHYSSICSMKTPKEKREIAQSEARDKLIKALSSAVPFGSAAYELITTLIVPLHEEKKREYINDLAIRLKKLEDQGQIDFEELAQNKEFNTIITKAILLAQQNHQKEKLEALRNIVLNSTKWLNNGEPIFDWSHKFLMIVDQISPLHILLLKTFRYPAKVARDKSLNFDEMVVASNKEVFFEMYPELKERSALVSQCWKELTNYGFLALDNFSNSKDSESMPYIHNHGQLKPQTTDFGNKFLDMIRDEY